MDRIIVSLPLTLMIACSGAESPGTRWEHLPQKVFAPSPFPSKRGKLSPHEKQMVILGCCVQQEDSKCEGC